jgi:hypothetical protein
MGRGVVRKTGYDNDHEDANPEVRLLRASLNGVGEASASCVLQLHPSRFAALIVCQDTSGLPEAI